MEVVIDGKTGLVASGAGATFQSVLEALRKDLATRRRIIVSLALDGEVLSRERQEALSSQAPEGGTLLEVRTADPIQLALETLPGLREHLDNIGRALDAAEGQFAGGEYARTLDKLEEAYHGWEILLRAVRDIGSLTAADFLRLSAEGESVDLSIRRLQAALLRFETALETKDVPRLNDIARDELRPQVIRWRAVFEVLGQHAARAAEFTP